jgi:hypothetical protein
VGDAEAIAPQDRRVAFRVEVSIDQHKLLSTQIAPRISG